MKADTIDMVQLKRDDRDLFLSADEDDDEILSNMSDSEEDDPNTLFKYKPTPTGNLGASYIGDWCGQNVKYYMNMAQHIFTINQSYS